MCVRAIVHNYRAQHKDKGKGKGSLTCIALYYGRSCSGTAGVNEGFACHPNVHLQVE